VSAEVHPYRVAGNLGAIRTADVSVGKLSKLPDATGLTHRAKLASVARSVRSKIIFAVALSALMVGNSRPVFASAGCDAVSGLNDSVAGPVGVSVRNRPGFSVGDKITFTITIVGTGSWALQGSVFNLLDSTTVSSIRTYTITGVNDTELTAGIVATGIGDSTTVIATCTPAGSGGITNSQIIDQMRQTFSKVASQTSANAMGESVNGALNDAFGGGGTTQMSNGRISTTFAALDNYKTRDDGRDAYAALGYNKDRMLTKAAPALAPSPWHAWIDAQYTNLNDRSDSANKFDGHNTNVTGGLSYKFNRDFVAGFVTGYEDFKYDVSSLNAFLKGDGWHAGGYFGWKFWDKLRLDGMLTYGQIDYGAQAGAVTGGWNADRVTSMLRLSGRYGFGTYYVEPSARVTWARETQDAFIDSAGVAHNDFGFTVGRASVGAEIGTPLIWRSVAVTPYVGLFGDYRFGDETIAAASVVPNLENGWTARLTGGFSATSSNGLTASIGGEYGGLGDAIQYWRGKASVGLKF
jgi:hypothetical protein